LARLANVLAPVSRHVEERGLLILGGLRVLGTVIRPGWTDAERPLHVVIGVHGTEDSGQQEDVASGTRSHLADDRPDRLGVVPLAYAADDQKIRVMIQHVPLDPPRFLVPPAARAAPDAGNLGHLAPGVHALYEIVPA